MEQILFYIMATVIVIATIFAITEKHPVHAIVYLVTSFFALAVVFYLLAAPLIAMFEVIIYAGAVMVLFMFVIMMLDLGRPEDARRPPLLHCLPALVLAGITFISLVLLLFGRSPAMPSTPPHPRRQRVCRHPLQPLRGRRRDHLHAAALCHRRGAVSGQEAQTMIVPLAHLLIFAAILFVLGLICVLVWRSNVIMLLIGIEIMLNAAMLVFVAGSNHWGMADGQVFALMIMAMTSAEVSLALAMVVYLHRRKKTVNVDEFRELRDR